MMHRNDSLPLFTRYFALVVGIAFTGAGIAGFLPFFTTHAPAEAPHLVVDTSYGLLLGLFPVNIIHNLFHFGWGITGILASRSFQSALRFSRYFGVILAVLTVMGLLPALRTGFGFMPLYGHDIWLHGLEAVIAIYLGFFALQKEQVRAEKAV
ncbi:MAG TPA: DUF4383 domain-containing protein [Anaerolineales bacterium]|nr:DUF4383 domain-containing protein [Anaerolineales bacterium]